MSEYTPEKTEKAEWLIQSLDLSVTTDQLFKIAPGGRLAFDAAYLDYVLQGIDETTARISRIRKDLLKESAPFEASSLQTGRLTKTEEIVTDALKREDLTEAEKGLGNYQALQKKIREEIADKKKLDLERLACLALPKEAQEGTAYGGQRRRLEQAGTVMQSALESDDLEGARTALADLKKARLFLDRYLYSDKVKAVRNDPRAKEYEGRLEELLKAHAGSLGLEADSKDSFFDQALDKLREATDKMDEEDESEGYIQSQSLIDLLKSKLDESELVQTIVVTPKNTDRLAPGAKVTMQADLTPKNAKDATVIWSVADPSLGTIDPKTGVLTGVGAKGGKIEVIATANDSGHALGKGFVALIPHVEGIEVSSSSYYLRTGGAVQLSATVAPFDANGQVRWTIDKPPSYLKCEQNGLITCALPKLHQQQSLRKSIIVTATAQDGSNYSTKIELPIFKSVEDITITAPVAEVKPGATLQLTAAVSPKGEAAEEVTWSVSNSELATIDATGLLTPTGKRGGNVTVTATAQDGSNKGRSFRVLIAMDVNDVKITAPPVSIQLSQTATLAAAIDPGNTGHRIEWTVDDQKIATIGKDGKLQPLLAGSVTVTAQVTGTDVSDSTIIQVNEVDPAKNLAGDDWNIILGMINRHVQRIKLDSEYITENGKKKLQTKLGGWREKIQGNQAITFQAIRNELVQLRNACYQPTHSQWLEMAGFSASGNCYLRNASKLNLGGEDRDIHLTMFVQGDGGTPLGNSFNNLRDAVFLPTSKLLSCHATCVIKGMDNAQVKVYVSGEPHTPPYEVREYMTEQGVNVYQSRPIVSNWMQTRYQAACAALLVEYNAVANLI